jgi:hypothetical protein
MEEIKVTIDRYNSCGPIKSKAPNAGTKGTSKKRSIKIQLVKLFVLIMI